MNCERREYCVRFVLSTWICIERIEYRGLALWIERESEKTDVSFAYNQSSLIAVVIVVVVIVSCQSSQSTSHLAQTTDTQSSINLPIICRFKTCDRSCVRISNVLLYRFISPLLFLSQCDISGLKNYFILHSTLLSSSSSFSSSSPSSLIPQQRMLSMFCTTDLAHSAVFSRY